MKTAILVTARLGSERLKRKHLQDAGGRPILSALLDRVRFAFRDELAAGTSRILIATTPEAENLAFEEFVCPEIGVFAGSTRNIPRRHLEAARSMGAAAIVAIDGDDILCSIDAMKRISTALREGTPYASTSGLPLGMNCAGYSTRFLESSLRGFENDVLETGWGRIFDTSQATLIPIHVPTPEDRDPALLRFTLDYPEDLAFFRRMIELLGDRLSVAPDPEILEACWSHDAQALNSSKAKEYWENFQRAKDEESSRSR